MVRPPLIPVTDFKPYSIVAAGVAVAGKASIVAATVAADLKAIEATAVDVVVEGLGAIEVEEMVVADADEVVGLGAVGDVVKEANRQVALTPHCFVPPFERLILKHLQASFYDPR